MTDKRATPTASTSSGTGRPAAIGAVSFIVAAVVFSGIAGLLLARLLEQDFSREPLKKVVVVKRQLGAGARLTAADLRVANWPQSSVPAGTFDSVEAVVKSRRVPLVPMVVGEAVLLSHLSRPGAGLGIASVVDVGKRAMSIRVGDPVSIARLVYPGAVVDVLSTFRGADGDGQQRMRTRVVLQKVKVLAVGAKIDPLNGARNERAGRQDTGLGGGNDRKGPGVVTLMVTPAQSAQLALASRDGELDLALRNPGDTEVAEVTGATRQPPPAAVQPDSEPRRRVARARRRTRRRPAAVAQSAQPPTPEQQPIRILR